MPILRTALSTFRHFALSSRPLSSSPSLAHTIYKHNTTKRLGARAMSSAVAKRLEGKTIVITGASSGIGRSTAFEFARTAPKDLKLVLTARRLDTLRQVAADIAAEVGPGVKVHPVKLDVSSPEEIRGFVAGLPEEFREIDVLVNNAGLVKGVARAPEIAEADMNVMFATNVTGLINMTQAVLPLFLARPDGGRGDIINIGSIAGREPYPGGGIYCATKAAVRSFTESLRKELVASRVRVLEVDPGQVETVSLLAFSFFLSCLDRLVSIIC
ncbi:NAD(P)-binding protein [Hypoxylon sp. NC1633]|nr:NAD(P)-binding protein [Hypoxylon sp. NC1633]